VRSGCGTLAKVAAIFGALRGGYLKVLVTNESVARRLLDLAAVRPRFFLISLAAGLWPGQYSHPRLTSIRSGTEHWRASPARGSASWSCCGVGSGDARS
jgi:anti-sigma factor RsiW